MSYEAKFGYMCQCGIGAECTEVGWIAAGRRRKVKCCKCGKVCRWRDLESHPIRAALADMAATPWSTGFTLLFIVLLCAALLSGWLGRVMGAAAVLYFSLPPHR